MDRLRDSQQPKRSNPASSNFKTQYLFLYNLLSASLWTIVLGRTLLITTTTSSYPHVYIFAGAFTKWTQTLAGLEVLHSALGLVRSPLPTTLMQVSSRFLLVWVVVHFFPAATALSSRAYASMLVAWSITEIIRYGYFAFNLSIGSVPGWLTWLRYNTFFVLYPLGIGSECWLIGRAVGPAGRSVGWGASWGLMAILGVYVPGSYVLFTHMMAQRRKIMRGEKAKVR